MNYAERAYLAVGSSLLDVEVASDGRFSSDVALLYPVWSRFVDWARSKPTGGLREIEDPLFIGSPSPRPSQVFAVGLNYGEHVRETNSEASSAPMIFTKFQSSISGAFGNIDLVEGFIDYEAELVAIIGQGSHNIPVEYAWSMVAGLTIGQDVTNRTLQMRPPVPQQFSLSKSYPGFSPIGPALVTPDELGNPDDLEITCDLSSERVQADRTSGMIFGVADVISYLSSIVTLRPGDVVFMGTPAGIGFTASPQRELRAGDVLVTQIEGLGSMRHTVRSPTTAHAG